MIDLGQCFIGIEFGSTRIKSVLIDSNFQVLAKGEYDWENKLENGFWTYSYQKIIEGMQGCYASLKEQVRTKFGIVLSKAGGIGISGMMHGYIPLDNCGKPLVSFRTWRNNNAEGAATELTKLFGYPVPARWSIAHLYYAIQKGEKHILEIATITTLAGYVHFLLTGKKVVGIGEASGIFPIDTTTLNYDQSMLAAFDESVKGKLSDSIKNILPAVLVAGKSAGCLTAEGALLMDPEGDLQAGIALCPPEGDAGTGMVATNSVKAGTGNVSAGTSIFSMVVLDKPLSRVHGGIDLVTTPCGKEVAMVHCNNCSSEINAWVSVFEEFSEKTGRKIEKSELYKVLFESAPEGDANCGGTVSCNYLSGENLTGIGKGIPLVMRTAEGSFNLANFMRSLLYSAFVTLKIGMDELIRGEKLKIDKIYAHGGIFKTEGVCQQFLADAMKVPTTTMKTASEDGAWGMAVLASYMGESLTLAQYLERKVFAGEEERMCVPEKVNAEGFEEYTKNFKKLLIAERALSELA